MLHAYRGPYTEQLYPRIRSKTEYHLTSHSVHAIAQWTNLVVNLLYFG